MSRPGRVGSFKESRGVTRTYIVPHASSLCKTVSFERSPLTSRRMENPRSFLERVVSSPDLARIVPHLQPDVVHRAIQAWGLEDSSELVALLTPKQISQILDIDLWRVQTGGREAFDAD